MPLTLFLNDRLVARGTPVELTATLRALSPPPMSSDLRAFDDETGRQVDFDPAAPVGERPRRRRLSPLGLEAKEVTLLPRHWDWLARQRGGASATLRKLVEEALRNGRSAAECHDAAFRFLDAMAGDLPGFEEALRAIYAGNSQGYDRSAHGWPPAIREHGRRLAFPE